MMAGTSHQTVECAEILHYYSDLLSYNVREITSVYRSTSFVSFLMLIVHFLLNNFHLPFLSDFFFIISLNYTLF